MKNTGRKFIGELLCSLFIHKWVLWYSKSEIIISDGKTLDYREEYKICRRCGQQTLNVWQEEPNKWKVKYDNQKD